MPLKKPALYFLRMVVFLFLLLFFTRSSFYYDFRGIISYCPTRESLLEKINSFQYEFSALPTITIDEDLDLNCNDLPATWIAAMRRKSNYPVYTIISNSSERKSRFVLDTSTSSEDNCPGFRFENLSLLIQGRNLKTTKFDLKDDVDITVENRNFHLIADIGSMSFSQIAELPNASFARLTLYDDYENYINTLESDDNSYNESLIDEKIFQTKSPLNSFEFGCISLNNIWSEPNEFRIQIKESTTVFFDYDILTINISNRPQLNIFLPYFNYSNGFYFDIIESNIAFEVEGNLNYSSHYPHAFYIIQEKTTTNLDITIGPGNYLNTFGYFNNALTGVLYSLTLHDSTLRFNNTNQIDSLYLENVVFYPYADHISLNYTFTFIGSQKVQENLNLSTYYIQIGTSSSLSSSILSAIDGKTINITVHIINSIVNIEGDVYVTGRISVPSSSYSITLNNLHFSKKSDTDPVIEIKSVWSSNADSPITVNGKVYGKAGLVPISSSKDYVTYLCAEDVSQSSYEIAYEDTGLDNIVFNPIQVDKCIATDQLSEKPSSSLVICFDNENGRCPYSANVVDYGSEDWSQYYVKGIQSITFETLRDVTIDLSPIQTECSVIFIPYVPLFSSSPGYEISILVPQEAADNIYKYQLGSTTATDIITIKWVNKFQPHGDVTLQKSVTVDPDNFAEFFDPSNLDSFGVEYLSQLNDLVKILPNIKYVFVNSKEILDYIEYTDSGWIATSGTTKYDITGFHHTNFTLKITKIDSKVKRVVVNVSASNPYSMFLLFSYGVTTTANVVELVGDWSLFEVQPIIVDGGLTIEMPFDYLPINLDDRIQYQHQISRRSITINKTGMMSQNQIITINSPFYMDMVQDLEFSNPFEEEITVLFTQPIESLHEITTTSVKRINYIFRSNMTIDSTINRFWSESNMIYVVKEGELNQPSFRDSVILTWDYSLTSDLEQIPRVTQADSLIRAKYILKPQNYTITQEEIDQTKRYYLILSTTNDMTFEEILDKIEFENDTLEISFINKTLQFELYTTYMFEFEPDEFYENGIYESPNALMLGVYLKRLDDPLDDGNDGMAQKGLNATEIAGIAMGAITGTLIIIVVISAIISKRKSGIKGMIYR